MSEALIQKARKTFHSNMLSRNVLTITKDGTASNADSASSSSKALALRTAEIIADRCGQKISVMDKVSGQTLGRQFEVLVSEFLRDTFLNLSAIRPGKWVVRRAGSGIRTSDFAQYEHLELLSKIVSENPKLAASIGNEYIVIPDIVIYRELYDDEELNLYCDIVNNETCLASDIRKRNGGRPILHASILAKFTIRSDRAQNSRTEALKAYGSDDSLKILDTLINGKRLKDISDLPLDLSV